MATLWLVLGCLGALLEVSGAIWWRFLAKMGPRWVQDGPSWQQVAPKLGHDSAKMTMLGSVWELLERSWEHVVNFHWDVGAMLEDVGSKMVFSGLSWAILASSWDLAGSMLGQRWRR